MIKAATILAIAIIIILCDNFGNAQQRSSTSSDHNTNKQNGE